jgi:hypothetical protein
MRSVIGPMNSSEKAFSRVVSPRAVKPIITAKMGAPMNRSRASMMMPRTII